MKRFLQAAILLLTCIAITAGCSQNNLSSNTSKQAQGSQYAQSPQELLDKYFKAASNRDERTALSCAGITEGSTIAGFWHTEDSAQFEGVVCEAKNITYHKSNPNSDGKSAIKHWLEKATALGLKLDYTLDDIESYGVVYFTLSMTLGEETHEQPASFDVVKTNMGWFLVSIDTAR